MTLFMETWVEELHIKYRLLSLTTISFSDIFFYLPVVLQNSDIKNVDL